jgi:AAA domain-containing protein
MADYDDGRAAIESAQIIHLPGQEPIKLPATPFTWREPHTIPRRQFLYGFELRRKQLSAMVAPGAAGKTTLKVGRALAMVTGRDMLGHRVWNGPHRVWLWNLEDEMEEVEKTVHAFCKAWGLDAVDLGDRLFIDGVDSPGSPLLKMAIETEHGSFTLRQPVAEALIEELTARGIDYLDVDPFVSSHSISENNNGAIDAVSKEWVRVAREANCAIGLTHHIRKIDGREATALDARGAGAMVNAARSCLVINTMSVETSKKLGIPAGERRRYISVIDDKNNKAPPPEKAEWYHFVGQGLGNADVGSPGPEDNIGVLERWSPPDAFGGVTLVELYHVQQAVDRENLDLVGGRVRKDVQAARWIGKLVARELELDIGREEEKTRIKTMVNTWLENGSLKTEQGRDKKGEWRDFVIVGKWVDPSEI